MKIADTNVQVQGASCKGRGLSLATCNLYLEPCTSPLAPRISKGFSLIELIVAITIIVILAGLLLTRIWFYQEQAEKAAMQQVAGALQSSLVMQYGHLLTSGKEAEINNLLTENPTLWLMQKPHNYAGEFSGITPAAIEPGNWAFDLQTHELVYVPYRTEYFTPGKDGLKWVRYRARLDYSTARGATASGRGNKAAQELSGVLFEPVEPYQWLVREEK